VKAGRDNSKNAYLLVYERIEKSPIKLIVENEKDRAYVSDIFDIKQQQDGTLSSASKEEQKQQP
jgi:hypothetical protein